ncbi:sulfatase-like hydrolase/transferase, partial [Patescibacteria group bacterium]|nr:sulfatase-like hydrolase/transferase [Patescibacteria group bacterium]
LTTARRTIDIYDGEIKYTDYLISQIVKTIKEERIDKDSIIILTADHGEQLGQHGMYGHAGLHEANTLIPFIAWGPGQNIPQGKKLKGYAQHTDIVPTVLDLITAEKRPEMAGESLLRAMNGKEPLREEIFMEGYLMRGIIRRSWKYIWHLDGREELYNMEKDPMEVINLVDKEKEVRKELRCSLERWVYKNLHHREDPIVKAERIIRKAKEENSYTSDITKLPWG